jgi:hypothetical protein
MAAGPITLISDVVVPAIFSGYIQQLTEEKSRLIQSGALARSPFLDNLLAGAGSSFNVPSFTDLDNDADRISTDTSVDDFAGGTARPVPNKIGTATEIATRLSRNNSWSSGDLVATLAGADPMDAIAGRVSDYWARRLQVAFVASMVGILADNTANDAGDYTNDVSGGAYLPGVTDFTTEAFIDTTLTMGDSMEDTTVVMVHSVVFSRMQKNNLIDFIPDARGEVTIPTFLGRQVVIDDGLPVTGSVYDTWLFGGGAVLLGVGSPPVGTEVEREAGGGNGGGQEILYSRQEWSIHPVGHAFVGTVPNGGPANTSTAGADLDEAASWNRVYSERKQIKFARLITREA